MGSGFIDRLKGRMQFLGFSQRKLAREMELSGPSVNAWLSGKSKVKDENIIKLAATLKTTPEWLLYGEGEPNNSKVSRTEIPVGRFKLFLGKPEFIQEDEPVIGLTSSNPNLKAIHVCDNSMAPEFAEGDLAVLDTELKGIEAGSTYGIFLNGRFILANLHISLLGKTVVSTTNPKESIDLDDCPILVGKVIMTIRRF